MPVAKMSKDRYANKFFGTVTESGANTLTYKEIQTSVNVFDKQAWILHRLEWFISPTDLDKLIGAADAFEAALTNSDKLTSLDLSSSGVIDFLKVGLQFATAVGQSLYNLPIIRDFSNLPGGGLIIAPRPLYLAVKGVSLGSAITVQCRGYFTQGTLSADEYIELVDFYRIVQ